MTYKNLLLTLGFLALFAIVSLGSFAKADGTVINTFFAISSSSSETISTTDTVVVATSTGRTWLKISNDSSNTIWCNYNKIAVYTQGFPIVATSTYTMNGFDEPIYTGAIHCIATSTSPITAWTNF